MICAGIDAGSRAIKIILIENENMQVVAKGLADQGVEQDKLASALFKSVLKKKGINKKDVAAIVATGYGRNAVSIADTTITEITCHAVGVHHLLPDSMTIIDIGGQDSKLMRLDNDGRVRDFAMNDRCAAGTGRFLEVVAERLGVKLEALGVLAANSTNPAAISSMCVVFAETEITGLLASGTAREDIVAGVQASIAARIISMAGRNAEPPVIFTGGVAMVSGMADAMQNALGQNVSICPDPQMTGALGAAILASKQLKKANA
jgi:predicted CoA-substrate-specific enzyme activase